MRSIRAVRALLISVVVLAVAMSVGGLVWAAQPEPTPPPTTVRQLDCPTEDSCIVDYRGDNTWHVTQVTP